MNKTLHILSWIPIGIIKIALAILGLIAVPLSLAGDGKHRTPKMWWIWGNDEEGPEPEWWMNNRKNLIPAKEGFQHYLDIFSKQFPRFWWLAIRNPVNNTRFIFEDPVVVYTRTNITGGIEAHHLVANGRSSAYRWAYSGPFAGYRKVWLKPNNKYSEIWFGWKVGSSVPGMGFTMQVRLNREIGT